MHRYGSGDPLERCDIIAKGKVCEAFGAGGSQQTACDCGYYSQITGTLIPSVELEVPVPRNFPTPAVERALWEEVWGAQGVAEQLSQTPLAMSSELPATGVRDMPLYALWPEDSSCLGQSRFSVSSPRFI